MAVLKGSARARFELVTAAHHFLLESLPLRHPGSPQALATFVGAVARINAPIPDVDFVLLRCLSVLNRHVRCIPNLLDQYLDTSSSGDELTRFGCCLDNVLRYHGVREGSVQAVLECVSRRFDNPQLTPPTIAASLGRRLATLDVAFKNQVGCTLTEHIRNVRLERAAVLLATSTKSIKEVWAEVGYSHHSNFDHDFKRKFACAPREYRARCIRPIAIAHYGNAAARRLTPATRSTDARVTDAGDRRHVLIVDSDDISRTSGHDFLCRNGYATSTASSGAEGLRAVERLSPDVMIFDYDPCDLDGLEFLRHVRGRLGRDIPKAILFTADSEIFERADEVRALNATIVSKLCDLDHLRDVVHRLLANSSRCHPMAGSKETGCGVDR